MVLDSKYLSFLLLILAIGNAQASQNQMKITSNFTIPVNYYIELLNTIITYVPTSKDSGYVNGTFFISTNASFDIFRLSLSDQDQDDMICYQQIMLLQNYTSSCNFLNKSNSVSLNQTNFTLHLVDGELKINEWISNSELIIIDNSPFPINGSNIGQEIFVHSTYVMTITPSNTFYYWTEILAITMGISLFFIFCLIVLLFYKTKKIKDQNLHERLVAADNQFSKSKGKDSKSVRKERTNFEDRELDLKLEKSNSILLSKSALSDLKKDKKILDFK